MHFSKTFHRSSIQGPAFIFLHSRQEGRVLGHRPGAHICKPIPTASQRESVWKPTHKSNWKLCSINKRKIPFGDLRLYECYSSTQDARVKHSQIIAFVSIKYRAESHAEMCGHRPKKKQPPVVDVEEKSFKSEHENKRQSRTSKRNKKRQELLVRGSKPPAPAETTGMGPRKCPRAFWSRTFWHYSHFPSTGNGILAVTWAPRHTWAPSPLYSPKLTNFFP